MTGIAQPLGVVLAIVLGVLALRAPPAMAQDNPAPEKPEAAPAAAVADLDAWRFRFAAYGWAMNVSGTLTARGQTSDVNASFLQLIQKSDSLIGYMGYF